MPSRSLKVCVSSLCAIFVASGAIAQEYLDEVTVTATKREQTLQEVPVAVSVTSAETIEKAQVLDILDLQTLVPSLRVTQLQSAGNTNFLIRGFGNGANNPGIEPSVGVFIDGVYRSRSAASISDLPNLERVEVLRGPQSTLFGKNASAGVVSVITKLPDTEFGGSVEVTGGNYGLAVVKGDVSIPLSDTAGVSFSAGANSRDGYFDNRANGDELNGRDRWNVRAQLALTPLDNVALRFIADYDEFDEECCAVGNLVAGPTAGLLQAVGGQLVPNNPFAYSGFFDVTPFNKVENSGISLQADTDIGEATFTSITALRNVKRLEDFDADFTSANLLSTILADTNIDTFTQEFRLSSSAGENVDWLVGVFFFDEDLDVVSEPTFGPDIRTYVDLLAGSGVPGTLPGLEAELAPFGVPPGSLFANGQRSLETAKQKNTAASVFAQLDWYLTDRTTITLGVNYTEDEKDVSFNTMNTNLFSSLDFVAIGFAGAFAQLEAMDPGNPANGPTAMAISTNPCPPTSPLPCNALLDLQPLQAILAPFQDFPNAVESGRTDDSEVTWTARLAFDVTDNVNMYFSASTGFKATTWNLSRDSKPFAADIPALQAAGIAVPNLLPGTRFAGPEESTVYEIGLKARFDQGSVNVAVFDQSIEGFQSNIFGGLGFNLANAGEQSATGLEIDLTYYPVESLQLTFAGTFMDPEYDSFTGATGLNNVPTDLSGMQPAGIHEQSITTSATWTKDFANGSSGYIRADYLYESDVQVVDNVAASIASREVNVVNASMGISTEGGWDFSIWGRNLTDDEFLMSAFPATLQTGTLNGYPNQPATYGLTIRKIF
ncbi:MAG: TonB-dependent receptor [Woeseiaceae bacterium]|nr:TonB-dependent receptor [Woeseiaceae bacterium]